MRIYSRSEINLKPARTQTPWKPGSPVGVIAHWNGSDLLQGNADTSMATVRSIQQTHLNKGYSDIAYNFLIDHNGNVFEGRGWNYQSGAHSPHNETYLAFCFLIDKDNDITQAQWDAFVWLRNEAVFKKNAKELMSHSESSSTSCPGALISKRVTDLRNGANMNPGEITKDQQDYINLLAYGSKFGANYDYRYTGGSLHDFLVNIYGPDPLKNPNTLAYKVKNGLLVPPGSNVDVDKLYNDQIAATKKVFGK